MPIYDAATLSRAWLAVSLASAKDADRPSLDHTVAVEAYPEGVRLVATDSYVLLSAWVPAIDRDDLVWTPPGLDDAPVTVAVARDTHGRATSLFTHLLKITSVENAPEEEVRLSFGPDLAKARRSQLDGFESVYLLIDHPDHERVQLSLFEGDYVPWRHLVAGFKAERTDVIAINPDMLGRVAKLGKLFNSAPVRWRFGGLDKAAHLSVSRDDQEVSGLVMPVRVEWESDQRVEGEAA